MRLSLRQIHYVSEVGRLGGIQAAARRLMISQSSIMAAIDRAETELGAAIFDRRPARGVVVTPAGARFLQAARRLLAAEAEFERALDVLHDASPPVVRIGCFEPFGPLFMTTVLRRYLDEAGAPEISLMGGDQTELHAWLEAGSVDIVVTYDIGPAFAASITPICRVPTHAILPADDPLALQDAVSILDLAERPIVLLDLPHTSAFLLAVFDLYGRRPRVQLRTRTYETVRSAVASGLGVSVLNMRPLSAASPDGSGLVRRPILDELPSPTLIAVDIYGELKPLFVRRLIALLQRFFAEMGPERFAVSLPERYPTLLVS